MTSREEGRRRGCCTGGVQHVGQSEFLLLAVDGRSAAASQMMECLAAVCPVDGDPA